MIHPFMNLVILSWMKISALRCTSSTKAKGKLCGNEVYLIILHRVSSAGRRKMKERKKERKKEKEEEENRGNQAFRPIMKRLLGKGLERSEGTSSIAQ